MASVSGVNSTNTNSIYGDRNIFSGLASGMDTETMIENSVSGYQVKIEALKKKQTTVQWKQTAYQSITDKMVQFSRKYTSYASSTNLMSNSFFNKAVTTSTNGANASCVSASGRSSSQIQVNGVAQLATASRYQAIGVGVLNDVLQAPDGSRSIKAARAIDLDGQTPISNLSGTMSLTYGNQSISVSFESSDLYESADAFATAIREKLSEQKITFQDGSTASADSVIGVSVSNGSITFTDNKNSGNDLYISSVTDRLAQTFSETTFNSETKVSSLQLSDKTLTSEVPLIDVLAEKSLTFNLDGISKTLSVPTAEQLSEYIDDNGGTKDAAFTKLLQSSLDTNFGSGKITVADHDTAELQLSFRVSAGSNLTMTSDINTFLGFTKSESTYLNTSKTLGDLLGSNLGGLLDGVLLKGEGTIEEQSDGTYRDAKDNLVNENGDVLGKDGNPLYAFELKINDTTIGNFTRDSALESVLLDINTNTTAGVNVSYSKTTNQFVFTAEETGSGYGIDWNDGLAETLFGAKKAENYSVGKDAVVNLMVNNSNLTITRSSNNFDIDGMSITVKNTFNGSMDASGDPAFDFLDETGQVNETLLVDPITFTTTSDADKIVSAVKSMIEDYNAMITEIHSAYTTVPLQKTNGSKYEPLSDTDKESLTETAIKNYEEKAKQGLLFADSDLSSLYNKLRSAISPTGSDGSTLRNMGITTDYYKGLTTLSLDETKLRDMLNTSPDTVRDAFTKIAGSGSSTNGLIHNIKTQLDTYSAVEGTKGILINKAGSKYSSLSLLSNSLKNQMDTYEKDIDKVQAQLSTKVDYYTRKFTRLEQLVSEMNAQSSYLSGFMG